jgi:NAD(P)H dehydrogenase (quinone)
MTKPKILVTSAAGRTGAATVLQLLEQGFPVRALVRKRDARSQALERAGAEVAVGDLFDLRDLRKALVGVQRAYHCPPFAPNLLNGAMMFAIAAEEAKLEVVALMSGWNPHPTHPSVVTREHWIANQLYRWMPSVDVIHVNPGIFAFMYLLGLPAIVHLGMLAAPFGDGRNAPPSNEDIARVVAGVLANPGPHIGKSYRPTGPELLSPHDIAGILTNVTGRKVKYKDSSIKMFAKAAKALGASEFEISQIRYYAEEIRHGAFEMGAPTDHVELVTGRKPESFESIARRYLDNPSLIHPRLAKGGKLAAFAFAIRMMLTRVPNFDQWERDKGFPMLNEPVLAHDSEEWRATAERQELNLLPAPVEPHDLTIVRSSAG